MVYFFNCLLKSIAQIQTPVSWPQVDHYNKAFKESRKIEYEDSGTAKVIPTVMALA